MKISKIAKLCKDEKRVYSKATENGLWIGNGKCAYLLPELTYLDQNAIALVLGISEKDKSKILFYEMNLETFDIRDIDEAETLCEPLDFLFSTNTGTVRPFKTQEGVLFLNSAYLAPLKDEIENVVITLRHTKNGAPLFAAKVGMYLYAIFAPSAIINKNYIDSLEEFNALCRVSFQNACAEQRATYEQVGLED